MQTVYEYAHSAGLEVIQVIPVFLDAIDEALFRLFLETCCDELALMNYTKETQISAIRQEIELCSELGMRVETVFETMPYSEKYSVTDENTYFYDGLSDLETMKSQILQTYDYENLAISYHHLNSMYHLFTGKYIAELYAYTDKNDPTRNELGQTSALPSITLIGSDASVIRAYLYNPNLQVTQPEVCYLAIGVMPGVTYAVFSDSEDYTALTEKISFTFDSVDLVDYTSIKLQRTASDENAAQPDDPGEDSHHKSHRRKRSRR